MYSRAQVIIIVECLSLVFNWHPRKYRREITFSVGGVRISKEFNTFSRSELTFNKVISMYEVYKRVVGIYRVNRKDDYILMSINVVK